MSRVVICSPLRTPVGRFGGSLRSVSATALAATVISEIVKRTGLDVNRVDDVILGHGYPSGESPAIGRVAALDAGLPITTPGVQVDRRCGSGLYAVLLAASQVQAGVCDVVLAGGTESMSQVEFYLTGRRFEPLRHEAAIYDRLTRARETAGGRDHPIPGGMIETAENLRREFQISRADQDALALESHRRAVAAQDEGRFDDEIVPVTATAKRETVTVSRDEQPRRDTSLEVLTTLRPVQLRDDPDATVTAGNASSQNDGAALCVVTTESTAEELGLRPMAALRSWAMAGVEPERMGMGPMPASAAALDKAGLSLADMDLIELNEAFAAQTLAVTRAMGLGERDHERINVNGSAISLGHPVGATGARILATLLHELRRRQARYGLETMCIGGGQGIAAVFERIDN